MSKNLKIGRSSKVGFRHFQKVAKNIVENMLQKTYYLATVMSNLALAVAGSSLG